MKCYLYIVGEFHEFEYKKLDEGSYNINGKIRSETAFEQYSLTKHEAKIKFLKDGILETQRKLNLYIKNIEATERVLKEQLENPEYLEFKKSYPEEFIWKV